MKYDYAIDDAAELKKPSTSSVQKRKMFINIFHKDAVSESVTTKRNVIDKAGKSGEHVNVDGAIWKFISEDGHVVKELGKEKWELQPFDGKPQVGSYEQILKAAVNLVSSKKK